MKKLLSLVLCFAILGCTYVLPTKALDLDTAITEEEESERVIRNVSNYANAVIFVPGSKGSVAKTIRVTASGTVTYDNKGKAIGSNLSVYTNASSYVTVSRTISYSGSKVIVNYTLKPKSNKVSITAGKTGKITLG